MIRTCLVPSVLTLAASLNYWPQQMPEPGGFSTLQPLLIHVMWDTASWEKAVQDNFSIPYVSIGILLS